MTEQAQQLSQKPHVVIATPGRLADHIESGTDFSLSKIQMLVIIVFLLRKLNRYYLFFEFFHRFLMKLIAC